MYPAVALAQVKRLEVRALKKLGQKRRKRQKGRKSKKGSPL